MHYNASEYVECNIQSIEEIYQPYEKNISRNFLEQIKERLLSTYIGPTNTHALVPKWNKWTKHMDKRILCT
jgi:hypothetical protein